MCVCVCVCVLFVCILKDRSFHTYYKALEIYSVLIILVHFFVLFGYLSSFVCSVSDEVLFHVVFHVTEPFSGALVGLCYNCGLSWVSSY